MDAQIIERFKKFQDTDAGAEYRDLKIEEVELVPLSFKNKAFSFVKGQNKYVRKYVDFNAGEIPVLGASLNNSCIYSHVIPIDKKDIITQPSVSFNKDNAKGSRAFLRDYPYVMDRHHICIIPNTEIVSAEYLYVFLDSFLELKNYGWGTNVASAGEIKSHSIVIPKNLTEKYTSLKIQDALVAFIEHYQDDNNRKLETLRKIEELADKIEYVVLPSLLKEQPKVISRFNDFSQQKKGVDAIYFNEISFRKVKLGNPQIADFPSLTRVPASLVDIKVNQYKELTVSEKVDYVPLVSGTMENNQISGYVLKSKLTDKHLSKVPAVSWTRINPKKFFIQENPVCTNDDSFVFTPNIDSYYKFLCMITEITMRNSQYDWGKKAGKTVVKNTEIFIPEKVKAYSSYEIQKLIVEYVEDYLQKTKAIKYSVSQLQTLLPQHTQLLIYKTFKG